MFVFPWVVAQNIYYNLMKKYGTIRGKCHYAVVEGLKIFKKGVVLSIHDKRYNASHVLLVVNFLGQDYVIDPTGKQYKVEKLSYPLKEIDKYYEIDKYMIIDPENYYKEAELDKELYKRVKEYMDKITSYRAV